MVVYTNCVTLLNTVCLVTYLLRTQEEISFYWTTPLRSFDVSTNRHVYCKLFIFCSLKSLASTQFEAALFQKENYSHGH